MASSRRPKRSPGYKQSLSAAGRLIYERMEELGMKQVDLAAASGLKPSKISRLLHDSHKKGNTYSISEIDINRISIALKWGKAGREKLRYTLFPELLCYDGALENYEGLVQLNCRLYDDGFPLIKIEEKY